MRTGNPAASFDKKLRDQALKESSIVLPQTL